MKVIVVLDSNLGMTFNNRRQSRDRKLIENIIEYIGSGKLYIEKYSEHFLQTQLAIILLLTLP